MSFVDASATRVLVNTVHLSGSVSGWDAAGMREYSQVTTVLDTGQKYLPSLRGGSLSVTGLFNAAAGDIDATIGGAGTGDDNLLWTVLPNGTTLGQRALITVSDLSGYSIASQVGDAVRVQIDSMPNDGVDFGVTLHALGAETADLNSTGVDNAASSSNGGVGAIHVTAYSGLTQAILKVQHSTDNVSFSDLITFTTVTGTTSQRSTVTGTVNRYTRSFLDVTGTGSITFHMSFARR